MTRAAVIALACCAFLCTAGVMFAPLLGIENDEALFGSAIWGPPSVMLMSYLGALKGWLYLPVFLVWTPGPYSVRIPAVLMGSATVWLFFLLLRRVAGERVAVIGAVLLATDSLFFLTTVYDWGPVALQHLLTAGAMLAMARFLNRQRTLSFDTDLALAFFLAGLALWDKAISIWILSALGVAALVVYPRELARMCSIRRAVVAAGSLLLGALPLVLYNFNNNFATLHQDSGFVPQEIAPKFLFLVDSLHHGLFGWITRTDPSWPGANLLGVLFVAALAVWPFVRRSNSAAARLMGFALVVLAVGFLEMAATRNAGASVHHTVLLWPFPQVFVALALGQPWRTTLRALATAAVAIVAAHNVFTLAAYRQDIRERGSTLRWTEGIYTLSGFTQPLPTQYFILDWGILENLVLLREGKLALHAAWSPLINASLSEAEKKMVGEWVVQPSSVFLAHVRGSETFHGCRDNLDAITGEMGLREVTIERIRDSRGQPVFEAFRFARQ